MSPPTIPSTKKIQTNHAQPERLIIHCSYHKVATTFLSKILKRIAKEFAWEFQSCKQEELKPETNIFLQHHSQVNLSDLPPYVGSHIIRDPRDMMISGYFYHLWTPEKWCHRKNPKYGNRSYQEALKAASEEEGIAMEIIRLKGAIKNMIDWDYANPNFIEIRLEDLAKDEKNVFIKIFEKYGFNQAQIELALSIVEQLSFEKRAGRERGEENRQSHFRKGVPGDWKNYFTSQHKELFRQAYPGALEKLGYEEDDDW